IYQLNRRHAPVLVVGRAGALGRNHWCAERVLGRAARAECRALHRLLQPAQDRARDAYRRLLRNDTLNAKTLLGVEARERGPQPVAAGRNTANAAPLPIRNLEHLLDELLRRQIACVRDGAGVLVLDTPASFL